MKISADVLKKEIQQGFVQLGRTPCSLCRDAEGLEEKPDPHFHGSDFGKCRRLVQYQMMFPEKAFAKNDGKAAFFYDGHAHERTIMEALRERGHFLSATASHINNEAKRTTKAVYNGLSFEITAILHTDGILIEKDTKDEILLECKAVKNWSYKKYAEGFCPPNYYGQMQGYMWGYNLKRGYLIVKNRDTSDISVTMIEYNSNFVQDKLEEFGAILWALQSGKLINRTWKNSDEFECKYCPFKERCW